MSSSAASPTDKKPEKPKRVGYYRDYLTPTLHRRFTRAAGVGFLGCYTIAVAIGNRRSLTWLIFPLGSTGLRSLLLFIPVLVIFILRVSQLHIGERTGTSPFNKFVQGLKSFSTYQTFAFYLFSAWWFGEIYVWSASDGDDLRWVRDGGLTERDSLNERPIFLQSNFMLLGIAQSFLHLYYDYGRIEPARPKLRDSDLIPLEFTPAIDILRVRSPKRAIFVARSALIITLSTFVNYIVFLRRIAFYSTLWFARLVWDVPRSSEPSFIPPYHWSLIVMAFTSSVWLMSLWEISNLAFSIWVSQPPLKKGAPLTSESRDPNASLLNGLKSKKSFVKNLAFWELDIISISDEARRKTIYTEYDRKDGSTWSQILRACTGVIEDINTRLIDTKTPPPDMTLMEKKENAIIPLPRLAAPLKVDPVFEKSPAAKGSRELVQMGVQNLVKSIGQSPSKQSSLPVQYAKDAWNKPLSEDVRKKLRSAHVEKCAEGFVLDALNSRAGYPFRQAFELRSKAKVFGSPRSDFELSLFAIDAMSRLAVAAVKEDSMGLVNKDIASIMRILGNIIKQIKTFMRHSPIHWTDSQFSSSPTSRRVREVDVLLEKLQSALRKIIERYETFAKDMDLTVEEMRAARMAAGLATT